MASREPTGRDASTGVDGDGIVEECTACGSKEVHEVSVQILTESAGSENAAFSREPYRVSTCTTCGTETRTRMNNA